MGIHLTSPVRPELLVEVYQVAAEEDQQLEEVLDEALTEWLEKRRDRVPEVIVQRKASDARRRQLYEELANWANPSRL